MDTYLIFHDRVADVISQTAELVRILDIIEGILDIPLFFQWGKVPARVFQFSENARI